MCACARHARRVCASGAGNERDMRNRIAGPDRAKAAAITGLVMARNTPIFALSSMGVGAGGDLGAFEPSQARQARPNSPQGKGSGRSARPVRLRVRVRDRRCRAYRARLALRACARRDGSGMRKACAHHTPRRYRARRAAQAHYLISHGNVAFRAISNTMPGSSSSNVTPCNL